MEQAGVSSPARNPRSIATINERRVSRVKKSSPNFHSRCNLFPIFPAPPFIVEYSLPAKTPMPPEMAFIPFLFHVS